MLPVEAPISKTKAPPVPAAIRQKARECIAHYVARANREQRVPLKMPTCSFDLRGNVAGRAHLQNNHVQLNAVLLVENLEHFIADTIPHEVAHLVTHVKHKGRADNHGAEWQAVMRAFGLKPTRCHSLDTSNSSTATVLYEYRCACDFHELTPRTHPSGLKGTRYCKKCKYVIQFTGRVKQPGGEWKQEAPPPTTSPQPFKKTKSAQPRPGKFHITLRIPGVTFVPRTSRPASSPPPANPNAPTERMLSYIQDLARSLKWPIPPQAYMDRRAASEFIERAKAARVAKPSPVTATVPTTDLTKPQTAPMVAPPTEKQLLYAQSIASRKKLTIPADVLASKRAISAWIDANK